MKKIMNLKRSRWLLLTIFALLAGMPARGQVTEGFEYATDGTTVITVNDDIMGLSNGWVVVGFGNYVGITTGTSKDLQLKSGTYVYEGTYSIGTQYSNKNTWLVCPVEVSGTMEFYARQYSSSKSMKVGLAVKSGDSFSISNSNFYTCSGLTSSYQKYTVDLGTEPVYIAFQPSYAFFDNVTYTPYEKPSGPALVVKDYNSGQKLTSPASYNFGLATAGTTHYFLLNNPGTENLGVSVSETGNFGATLSTTTVPAGGASNVALTVTMPNATSSSTITITPASGSGIDPFVINVSGTLRDPNKVYLDFADGQIPDGWTSVGLGSYTSDSYAWTASVGYIGTSASSSYYYQAFTSPKLVFAKDEQVFFETAKYGSSTWNNPSIVVEYSLDGTTWTAIGSAFTDDVYGTWTSRSVTIPVEGVKYIRFNGWYVSLRNIYGGELANEPNMKVTQPASLDYGVISTATDKTFTIANTGKATLEGINVTSSNPSFTVSGAPTSLAAGESQEVTITMDATTTGALSSDITVSATNMTDVQFTVTGAVLPDGMSKEEFTDGLPANWTNASWTFANGIATGKSSDAFLTTPKLVIADGDLIVLKARRQDSDTSDYLTVQGSSDNGSTWTAYSKKLQNADGLTYPDFGTIVLSDIPSTVNKLRFVGYYAEIDEIWGLTYAPVLSVTLGGMDVTTPANFNFGDCTANASVPYTFANVGAGSIDITNVAITGDGAASYSTNWTTSVATPFDLVITRTYDATKAGAAQNAVVTVTTSVGDFVINVTGTDKAANAPELAVSTNAIDFGKVAADAVESVTVTNDGTGLLEVIIASDSEDFVVSTAALENIAPGESKTFTVTFKFGTPYGAKSGNVTVTPTYDATAAQTITLTGKAADPSVWSEDFSGNALPTGWEAGANWSFTNGVAKAAYQYGSTTYLTTPTLTVNDATDELTFDYKRNNAKIVIQKKQGSGDWESLVSLPSSYYATDSEWQTYTITGLEAGNYQFRFANDDYQLDNFEGFKLNLADHIASISAYTIPASSSYSMTMKEGQSFDATVTVKELRGVAEALTAKLYMGTEVIGTQTGSVAANGTETLTITCTPTTGAPSGAEMHIEVEYAGGTLSTETVTRYVAAITYLTLDETSTDPVVAGTYDNVTLKRKFNADWNTVCLPFTISDVEAFFGAGAKAYNFSGYSSEGTLSFSVVTELTASYPYIVYVPAAITDDIALTNITIASSDASAFYRYQSGAYFRGTYAPVAAGAWTKNDAGDVIYGVTSAGKIAKAGANASIKGFRAYFDLPAGTSSVKGISFDDDDTTTFINGVAVEGMEDGVLYDLNGRRVNPAQTQLRGTYILNGKKVMFK